MKIPVFKLTSEKIIFLSCALFIFWPEYDIKFRYIVLVLHYLCIMLYLLKKGSISFGGYTTQKYVIFYIVATFIFYLYYYGLSYTALSWIVTPFLLGIVSHDVIKNDIGLFYIWLKRIAVICGIVGIYGIIETLTTTNIFHQLNPGRIFSYDVRFGISRISTVFNHPINYCAFLLFAVNISFYLISLKDEIIPNKRLYKIIYFLLLVNAFLTMSRGHLLLLLFTQCLLFIKQGLGHILKRIILLILLISPILLFVPSVREIFVNIFYMLLAIVDSSYTTKIQDSFGGSNLVGTGQRFDLYQWVYDAIKEENLLFGKANVEFTYMISFLKTSIENNYLSILYRYGVVGLGCLIILVLGTIGDIFKGLKQEKLIYEERLSFSYVMFAILSGYYIGWLIVAQTGDVGIYFFSLFLLYSYTRYSRSMPAT